MITELKGNYKKTLDTIQNIYQYQNNEYDIFL